VTFPQQECREIKIRGLCKGSEPDTRSPYIPIGFGFLACARIPALA